MTKSALKIVAARTMAPTEPVPAELAPPAPHDSSLHTLSDGATVAVRDGAAEIRDAGGRLLVRYRDGAAEICAPEGDLVLSSGARVVVRSKEGVSVETPSVDVATDVARVAVTGGVSLSAAHIASAAKVITHTVERYELTAIRVIERARDVFRDAADLVQTRAGRVRTIVEDAYSLHADRTSIVSEKDTSIDGKRVLLG